MKFFTISLFLISTFFLVVSLGISTIDDLFSHVTFPVHPVSEGDSREKEAEFWINNARKALRVKLQARINVCTAKNVILFVGDGMSVSSLTASRIFLRQLYEEEKLAFDEFPFSGLSKTYCVNSQVADSACSSTAYSCGVKNNLATLGVTAAVKYKDCKAMLESKNHVDSIAHWAQLEGKRTGIVTTTRVTHASPAGMYAHTACRSWESDRDVLKSGLNPQVCQDIASQLINCKTGKLFNVILGCGRKKFLPNTTRDEYGRYGERWDGVNLIKKWQSEKKGKNARYVYNTPQLFRVPEDTEYLLGLFGNSHCEYNRYRHPNLQPSLADKTEAAIKVLSRGAKGYFLFVEGGLIDIAHHTSKSQISLMEVIEFSKAVQRAVNLTNPEDTLIVVTADHGHTMTISGYPSRDNSIFGFAGTGRDSLKYTTLSYASGAGYKPGADGGRYDLSKDPTENGTYKFPTLVPMKAAAHDGSDVPILARGPFAHLFGGVLEQNLIPHVMGYASCIGPGPKVCDDSNKKRD